MNINKQIIIGAVGATLLVSSYKVVFTIGKYAGIISTVNEMASKLDKHFPGFKKEYVKSVVNDQIDKVFSKKESN